MHESSSDDNRVYVVVVNDEEQYSIWGADTPPPSGWKDAGKRGSCSECLAHIDQTWTDMRPKSVRERARDTSETQA